MLGCPLKLGSDAVPIATVPLWHAEQPPAIPVWSNVPSALSFTKVVVVWQSLHSCVVARWPADLPVAITPSWQALHAPNTSAWSTKLVTLKPSGEWQV